MTRMPMVGRCSARGSVRPPSLPAGINSGRERPSQRPGTGRHMGDPFVPHQRPGRGGRSRPDPTAWSGLVGAPARALCRSGDRETPCVARTFGRCPQERTTKHGREKQGVLTFSSWSGSWSDPDFTRDRGGRGAERDAPNSRRSSGRTYRRRPPDRPACAGRWRVGGRARIRPTAQSRRDRPRGWPL